MVLKSALQGISILGVTLFLCIGCSKLTQVPEPVNTITTSETFATDATATSALVGIYNDFLNNFYGNGNATIDLGMSADELLIFGGTSPFQTNTYNPANGAADNFWTNAYFDIYLANAAIEALPVSTGVSSSVKQQLTGEAEFFRAYFHFYLVNLYGEIPIVTTTAYRTSDTLHRSPISEVYQQIIGDLKNAQNNLADDYSVSNGERIRVNKFGATALLARAYLYDGDWVDAETQSFAVINNTGLYSLDSSLNSVFLANSNEAILQLATPNQYPYATQEADNLMPYDSTSNPNYYLTPQLLGDFENGDQRRITWVDSTDYMGVYYYYPFKYKVFVGTQVTEYYMILRLAEQYLIRAEARAEQNNLNGAINDLNIIRGRAQLQYLPLSLSQNQVLAAVSRERRIELFAELGQRWLDLKRSGQIDSVLGGIKPTWESTAQFFSIPASELINDANLVQNSGY